MPTSFPYPKGSRWRKWDLHTQTILDDGYVSLEHYADDLKRREPDLWNQYVAKVGGEGNAILFDSKDYFFGSAADKRERCRNYVRNYVAYVETFNPDLECIGITDHNYFDDLLLDVFVDYTRGSRLKVIPGVEINCGGVHMLLFFPTPPYERPTFSQGINGFLAKLDIHSRTDASGVLIVTGEKHTDVIDEVEQNDGIVIYPHCNNDNGLFQERGRTDRTHLANIFNHQRTNLLQSRHADAAKAVEAYAKGAANLTSACSAHISSDARALKDLGAPDKDGNFLWIKADPTFEGLRQILYEPEQRIFIGPQRPGGKKSYFVIDKVRFIDNRTDAAFGANPIEINENLTTIIGGKSTGKSLLLYCIAKTIDESEVRQRVTATGVPVNYDVDQDPNVNFEVTWQDGQTTLLKPPLGSPQEASGRRKLLYIPQKYLNALSETNIKSREALNAFVLEVIKQDPTTAERHDNAMQAVRSLEKAIRRDVTELFSDREDIERVEGELKEAGDEQGIRTYVATLEAEINQIATASGLTPDERTRYDELGAQGNAINAQLAKVEEDLKTMRGLAAVIPAQLETLRALVDEQTAFLTSDVAKSAAAEELTVLDTFAPSLLSATERVIARLTASVERLAQQNGEVEAALAPLVSKVSLQVQLRDKTDAINREKQKLNEVTIKKGAVKTKREGYERKLKSIGTAYDQLFGEYDKLRNDLKPLEGKFGEIRLGVHVGFDEAGFDADVVRAFLNRTDLKRVIPGTDWSEEFSYRFDPTKHRSLSRRHWVLFASMEA